MKNIAGVLPNTDITSTALATRGARLVLSHICGSDRGLGTGEVTAELLSIVEIDTNERIVAHIGFDVDDIDAAFEELETRYLAGEAAAHAPTWSVIARGCAAFNRREFAATTPDPVYIDHRPLVSIVGVDLAATQRLVWDLTPDARTHIEAILRLSGVGAVVTQVVKGTSPEGLDAEWQMISILTVEGDLISHYEVFDEADLDAALARFEELQPDAYKLENAASQAAERFLVHFAARDWDSMAKILAADISMEDRRRGVNAGARHGRDAAIEDLRASVDAGFTDATSTTIATRGGRLGIARIHFSERNLRPEAFQVDVLHVIETNPEGETAAVVIFDIDDIDAAFDELEARYVAGEAAAHADTWSVIAEECAAFNRRELPTADWVTVDHRRLAVIDATEGQAAMRAIWDVTPNLSMRIAAVHRLTSFGAVASYVASGTSPEGVNAEWPMILLLALEGERINRVEVFDAADLDAALARFDELEVPAPRLENAASRVHERLRERVVAHDWKAATELLADDIAIDDRRRVVNSGVQYGRDAAIADMRGASDLGLTNISLTVTATRGDRLELCRTCLWGQGPSDAFRLEFFSVLEIDSEERIAARVAFDLDDIDAAFEELETRYLAGEAAAYARTWTLITRAYAALNRRQLPETTDDWVNVDHRRLAPIAADDLGAYLLATWELSPQSSIRIEAVHRLSKLGAVVTQVVEGTSHQGFDAEWRTIDLCTYDGDKINRSELFDEADLHAALARFEELDAPNPLPERA
jgi:hypothetical protein